MTALRYRDEHNKVGYLLKPIGSDDYHQIIDFLKASHIRYALTHNPIIFDSLVKQFWSTAMLRSPELADDGGIDDLPIAEIYSGMDNLGTKSGSWDQFGSPLVVALICLSNGRQFNWSSYIFKGMVSNIGNAKMFLMYPRFLQIILGIETRIKRQYNVLKFSSKLFANMRLNFEGYPMPLLPAMLSQDQEGEGAGVAAQAIPQHIHVPDQPQDHLSTPPRQQTSNPNALVFEHGQNKPLGGSFHMSPPRSTQAPPASQTLGGAEDLITLTALSSVVSTLVQKVNYLETELKDHKKLFKDVVGKLVKKVKAMKVKLKTTKKKMVVSDSDQKEGGKQDMDLDALLALANAVVTVDSNIPPGGASNNHAASTNVPADVSTSATVPTGSTSVPADVLPSAAPAGVSNKGKTLMVDEVITVKERTFKQMQEDRLGEQAAKRLHDEEQAQVDRQIAEMQRKRQQEVLDSAMYYTEADWIHIMAQVEANASLSKTLLGNDVSEDNFPARMAALIKRKKQALAEKLSSAVYSTGWSMAYVKSFTDDQLKEEFEKIQKAQLNIQIQAFSRTLKSTELDLDADDQTFIKVVSNEDSEDEAPLLWSALVGWEDLMKLYGLVVMYYENHPVAGAGLILWGDLHVLFDSYEGDVSYPFSVKLMERMLKHKLEIDKDVVGNDMTTAEQLIRVFNSPMLYLLRVEMVINSPWIMPILRSKELASPEQMAPGSSTDACTKTSVANNTSGLVPQRQKASDYDNPDPVPQRQDVYSSADADVPSQ
nr:hypothetical protein [Tanacetum cinerariifolium]